MADRTQKKGLRPTAVRALAVAGLFALLLAPGVNAGAMGVKGAEAATELTVMEVARDLACPCECPLILEDCNMSCGLRWKNEIGALIAEGKTRQEIIDYFIAEYGEGARISPLEKLHGKVYQYTRGFGTLEWTILGAGTIIWVGVITTGLYILVRRRSRKGNGQG